MTLSRRQFVILTVSAAAGCGKEGDDSHLSSHPTTAPAATAPLTGTASAAEIVDVGPLTGFVADAVYDSFREQGFFIIRHSGQLFALSSICTHKGCKVRAQADRSFYCKCHKSEFDSNGNVVKGP